MIIRNGVRNRIKRKVYQWLAKVANHIHPPNKSGNNTSKM